MEAKVVTLGPRRPDGRFVVAALAVVVVIAVLVGTHRSSDPQPALPAVTVAPQLHETTVTPRVPTAAVPAIERPASFTAVPSLQGYRLRGVLWDGTVFSTDIETGRIESWTPVPGRAGGVEALTSESFIVRQPDRSLVVSFDSDAPLAVISAPGRLIPADGGFAVEGTADGVRSMRFFDSHGDVAGTLAPLPWSEALDIAGLTVGQIVLEGYGSIFRVPYQPGPQRGTITAGPAQTLAAGDVVSVGGGMVAYRACDATLDCQLRVQRAAGGPELIVTTLAPGEIDRSVARFTPDGKTFITSTRKSDGAKQIALVDTATVAVTLLPASDGDQNLQGADNISVTADSALLVWQFDERRFAFRDLHERTAAVVELPVPALYVTLTPRGL